MGSSSLGGASGAPLLCTAQPPPLPTAPKDVATLSLTVLKDPESAARPVGRYLLHAKSYSVSGPCPQSLCGVFVLCGILSPSLRPCLFVMREVA